MNFYVRRGERILLVFAVYTAGLIARPLTGVRFEVSVLSSVVPLSPVVTETSLIQFNSFPYRAV